MDFSILFENVKVEKGATITDSIIMPGARVEEGATVQYAIIAENVTVKKNAVVGERPENCSNLEKWGVCVVGAGLTVGENAVVGAGVMVKKNVEEGERV